MQKNLLDRQWKLGVPPSPDQITILQWNILADWASYAFPKVDPQFLTWEYRKPLIIAEILRAEPDIVCLQEVDHFEEIKSLLLPQYDGYFKSKGTQPGKPSKDGGAIFWRRNRLTPRGEDGFHYSRLCERSDMKQVLMSAQFEFTHQNGDTSSIRIIATHLKAKLEFDEVRQRQCQAIAKFLELDQPKLDLTVVCGDFNTDPQSKAIETLLQETKSHPLQSAYRSLAGNEPDWTTWKIRDKVKKTTIDFVFHDSMSQWKPIDVWQIPDESQIDPAVALPCAAYPSDHLALATTYQFMANE